MRLHLLGLLLLTGGLACTAPTPLYCVNAEGKVDVADTGNGVIRVIHAEQTTTHALFKPGTLTSPTAVAQWDTVVVADPITHGLRTEDVFAVKTLVGTGQPGFVNGPLATAQLSGPYALATRNSLQLVATP